MKKIKVIIQIFFLITLLTGCQSAKDVLTGKKANSQGEEFLVEKKNPLVVPPDFDEFSADRITNNKTISDGEYSVKDFVNQLGTNIPPSGGDADES